MIKLIYTSILYHVLADFSIGILYFCKFMSVKKIFEKENIEYVSALTLSPGDIRRPDIAARRGLAADDAKTAIVFLIPYYVDDKTAGNVSLYARSKDYHLYCEGLFERVEAALTAEYGGVFIGFADKSPIEETHAALEAGLAIRGDSYVIINEKYGSFVFIGEIITNVDAQTLGFDGAKKETVECHHCGACRRACPMKDGRECLSSVTQKKGELTEAEEKYIVENGCVWGCDICQTVCPLSKNVAETPIDFFRSDRIANIDIKTLDDMSDEEFSRRAFSWRGKAPIRRNLLLFENNK